MSEPEAYACGTCGAHADEARPWLVRLYRAVSGAKQVYAIHLNRLADDVEALVSRLKGLEK